MDQHVAPDPTPTDSAGEPTVLDGNGVAERIRSGLQSPVETLAEAGVTPELALVSMPASGAGRTYVSMKQRACAEIGLHGSVHELDSDAPEARLLERIERLNADPGVDGIAVQTPLPDHVDARAAADRIDPRKDVEAVHPETLGRLVVDDPGYKPPTPHGIQRLLDAYGIKTAGKHAVVVGRSATVGRPIATLLSGRAPGGDATTTICHSGTDDLAAVTRTADILVVAAGDPELIDAGMLSEGVVVVDVGINRIDGDAPRGAVGDVDFESAATKAEAITPVPGGVGPLTLSMLPYNVVDAASRHAGVDVELP
jgi:methylenetetrahydrofolate dehydrogenase (NADP+)/methenyltetrahydrofolate cyclohydrolase